MSKPTIALDIDGVVFNNSPWMIKKLNRKFRTDYAPSDIVDFEYSNFSERERLYLFTLWKETDYHVTRLPESFDEVMQELREDYRVIAVSTPMKSPLHITSKYQRLTKLFGDNNVYLCRDKNLIDADILIDDAPHNITAWAETERPALCYHRPYNKGVSNYVEPAFHHYLYTVYGFERIPAAIKEISDRHEIHS